MHGAYILYTLLFITHIHVWPATHISYKIHYTYSCDNIQQIKERSIQQDWILNYMY